MTVQQALVAELESTGFSEVSTHPVDWRSVTTGSQQSTREDGAAIMMFYFTAVR